MCLEQLGGCLLCIKISSFRLSYSSPCQYLLVGCFSPVSLLIFLSCCIRVCVCVNFLKTVFSMVWVCVLLCVCVWRKEGGCRPDGRPGARGDEISPQEAGIHWSFQMSVCGAKDQNRLPEASLLTVWLHQNRQEYPEKRHNYNKKTDPCSCICLLMSAWCVRRVVISEPLDSHLTAIQHLEARADVLGQCSQWITG